ncbi:interactor of constitutive active ROPs 4-like [Impatiens glandulifera]|uniref:interactor of constitutive active ROPs 4-like n=1 Tax=Impatiens glandulifera TaxID=253017 RepID=UPI001FB0C3B5|nr:interactor of constitutive active ROPs 4-like [Impatiens glandulifera]
MSVKVSRSSESEPLHRRPVTQRSPRLQGERAVIPIVQSDVPSQKKLGSRISDLESQLGQAQQELKLLKGQVSSIKVKRPTTRDEQQLDKNKKVVRNSSSKQTSNGNDPETDVFEVPLEERRELKHNDVNSLKAALEEKEKELERSYEVNRTLKTKLEMKPKEEELRLKLDDVIRELEGTKGKTEELIGQMRAMEAEKQEMGVEMKKLRIQTEQWRKVADAAAIVLSEGAGTEGKDSRISESSGGSIDKQYGNIFENPVGGGYADDEEESPENGKRRSTGMRMFGDLWRKKVHK